MRTGDLTQRQPRVHNKKHLEKIGRLPCAVCGAFGSDAAHLRASSIEHGKRQTGMGEKPDDKWTTPLCRTCHTEQHSSPLGEVGWWEQYGLDPFDLCERLWGARDDEDGMLTIIRRLR